MASLRDERGLVGKLAILWLVLAAVFVVAVIDGVSIAYERLHLSDVGTAAAGDATIAYRDSHDAQKACIVAAQTAHTMDAHLALGKHFCTVNTTTGAVTITLHKEARTILAGRISMTKKFALVTDTETNSPPSV
jgi:hypothetical protein